MEAGYEARDNTASITSNHQPVTMPATRGKSHQKAERTVEGNENEALISPPTFQHTVLSSTINSSQCCDVGDCHKKTNWEEMGPIFMARKVSENTCAQEVWK
jgi:hypothetical protein